MLPMVTLSKWNLTQMQSKPDFMDSIKLLQCKTYSIVLTLKKEKSNYSKVLIKIKVTEDKRNISMVKFIQRWNYST